MTRRPSMRLRVGDTDLIIAYEQRGQSWVLYWHEEGAAPGSTSQTFHQTVLQAHEAWTELCIQAIRGNGDSLAPPADQGTRKLITQFLEDIPI